MPDAPRIGIVDSGCRTEQAGCVEAARGFVLDAACIATRAATPYQIGHGTAVLGHVARLAPTARFLVAQVFHARAIASPAQIAAAIDWLTDERVQIINLSLGFRADRASLRQAGERAIRASILICAASPARGLPVFPASYPGVLRITGDARCQPHQWSWLDSTQADFGAAMSDGNSPGAPAGASMATAIMSGHIAAWLARHPGSSPDALRAHRRSQATYIGIERRVAASAS